MYRQQQGYPQQQQLARLPEPSELVPLVTRTATNFARRHKYITGSYFLGIVVLLFFTTGVKLTLDQQRKYNRIMDTIDLQAEYDAASYYWQARNAYRASKGWFFSCDSTCQRMKARMKSAEQNLNVIRKQGEATMSEAKATAGLFSEVGVEEVKDSFWQYLQSGKDFAKRQSYWDLFFMSFRTMRRGRDEGWFEFALKVLMNVLLNFSMGLCMAFVFFVLGLWNIIRSYQPNPLTALVFFLAASAAAFAFVATYLLAVYGAAATGVYGFLKVAETSARAQIAEQQRRERLRYDNRERPHYE